MTDLNPFDPPLRCIQSVIAELSAKKNATLGELEWFEANNNAQLNHHLQTSLSQSEALRQKCHELETQLASCQRELYKILPKFRTLWNPQNWFAPDQVRLRKVRDALIGKQQDLEAEKKCLSERIQGADRDVQTANTALKRYSAFDLQRCKEDMRSIDSELASELAKAKIIEKRKTEVDHALKPIVDQIQQYKQQKHRAESTRNRATALEHRLSRASNSYERAMVHKECEAEFNVGRPSKVISQSEQDLRRIERDIEKVLKRAQEIGQRASRIIDTIVVDGNNLCYENGRFIGLAALDALIPRLQPNYSVITVFDAAIRRMLKADDKTIASRLGNQVKVHIVASGGRADETILDIAGADKHTYILSNDRFVEYNEKSAIIDRRIFRHEIVNGRILIHDLGIDTDFGAA
jgi:hypothetical protein